jgi:hypothetical protein
MGFEPAQLHHLSRRFRYYPEHVKRFVFALNIRHAVALTAAGTIFGASLVFGCAGTAHAHGTFTAPPAPHPRAHIQGPFSVLHQEPLLHQGPFSVLHEGGVGP